MTENPAELRPEPVVDEGKIAGTIAGAIVAVVGLVLLIVRGGGGDLSALQVALEGTMTAAMAAAAVIAPIWRARKARAKVTPLEDPRTPGGVPLIAAPLAEVRDSEGRVVFGTVRHVVQPQRPGEPDHAAPDEV